MTGADHLLSLRARALSLAALSVVACLALRVAPAHAERADNEGSVTLKIEAESYWWGHDAGGDPNGVSTCADNASGGKTVSGLDYPGDWIMMVAKVPEPMFFKVSLRAAEDMGLRATFAIEFLPQGPGVIPAADTLTTAPGRGAG